jgi:hypothetical protein
MSVTKCFSDFFFSRNTGKNKPRVPLGIKNRIHTVYLEDPGLQILSLVSSFEVFKPTSEAATLWKTRISQFLQPYKFNAVRIEHSLYSI